MEDEQQNKPNEDLNQKIKELEEQNKKFAEEIANYRIGGKSEAGFKKQEEEETDEEYTKKFMKGEIRYK